MHASNTPVSFLLPRSEKQAVRDGAQYSHLAYLRLSSLSPAVVARADEAWPTSPRKIILAVSSDEETRSQAVVLVGLMHRRYGDGVRMREVREAHGLGRAEAREWYRTATRDAADRGEVSYELADRSGRAILCIDDSNHAALDWLKSAPSGVVVAARGVMTVTANDLRFKLVPAFDGDACLVDPGPPPSFGVSIDEVPASQVLLLSGLRFGATDATDASARQRERLCEWARTNREGLAHILIAGGMWAQTAITSDAVHKADSFLAELCAAVPVILMPGEDEAPADCFLPQAPFPKLLVRKAIKTGRLTLAPNPYCGTIGGRVFLGSSGAPLDDQLHDMNRHLRSTDRERLEALAMSLQFRTVAPTAPDTLPIHPLCSHDPFTLEGRPHVYFAGCQRAHESRSIPGTRLGAQPSHGDAVDESVTCVLVPEFKQPIDDEPASAPAGCLIELATLACTPLTFDADQPDELME